MILEIIDEKGHAQRITGVRRLVARDDRTQTPVVAGLEHYPGAIVVSSAGDPDFQETLRQLGVLDTVVVADINPELLQPRVL